MKRRSSRQRKYRKTVRYWETNRESIHHWMLRFSVVKDFVLSAGKIALGIFTASVFLCISGLHSMLADFARRAYLEGEQATQDDPEKAYAYYLRISLFILGSSVAFTAYTARLFFHPANMNYGLIPSLAIAMIAFLEMGFAIAGVVRTKDLLATAMKLLNLVSAFSALLLTQVAILSFAAEGDMSFYNAIGGLFFGGLGVSVALCMLAKYALHGRKHSRR